jgi:hypothetical protein
MAPGRTRNRVFGLAIAVWLASTSNGIITGAQGQDQRPQDSTAIDNAVEQPRVLADGEAEKDDPRARLQWERAAWGVPNAAFRSNVLTLGKDHADKKNARGPKWVSIGPFGADYEQNGSFTGHERDSGRARTILPHPTNPDIVYFLTSGGGLWRTNNWTNAETNWTVLTDNLPTTSGGSVAFGRNPNTLFLGLGDFIDTVLVGGAMTKSTNGGVSWSPVLELGTSISVRDVKVDTSTNRDIVLVATDNGLFRSSNEGDSYSAIATFAGLSVWSIVRTSAGWLASAQPCDPTFVGVACGQATTLYLSKDLGATWAPITNTGGAFADNGRTTLGVAVPGDAVVYAYSSTVNEAAMKDVYRSSNGGQTWVANGVNSTKIPTNPVAGSMPNMNICHGQCFYNQMVLVDPRDPVRNTVWIGGDLASARTHDGGSTWTIETWWLYSQVPGLRYAHADMHAAAFKTTGTPTIILGNDGGMNVSEDDGVTFSSNKNERLVTHLYYTVAGNPEKPNLVIGGTQDNGTRLRTDNGGIHNQVIGGDGMGTAYSQANTNTVLGSAQGSAMRTNLSNTAPDVFQNWTAAATGLSDPAGAGFFTAIVPAPPGLDDTGRVFFHFTSSRVWKTVNGGLNWTRIASATSSAGVTISPGFPTNGSRRFRSSPYNLGVSPADVNRIAVGAASGFLDISTDGGASWADIDLIAKVPGYQGFVTNVTWQDNQTLWITSVAQIPGAVRVIKASVSSPSASWATASFAPMQSGLPDLGVTRVYFDPRDPARATIFAATDVGVYRTVNGGAQWEPYSNGLPNVIVTDIYMPPDGSFTRIATYGRGIWELSQIELVNTTLSDNASGCDRDGVLDNGESGDLVITLANQGPNNLNQIELTVASSNPHVTFPLGNVVKFPPLQKRGTSTGSIRVAVDGAAGVESTDFQISILAPELELPSLNVTATHRVNYDDSPGATATETVESANPGWTMTGSPVALPNITSWQRRTLSATRHVWWGPDNNGQIDGQKNSLPDEQNLVSPIMHVGTTPLAISFQHRFSFENGGWDGGVIEISTDNGATWTDIGTAVYNGQTNANTSAPIGRNHRAFVNRIVGWPNFAPVTVNVGTTYANQDVRIRFRVGADETTGAPGWDVDGIAVSGVTNLPFAALVANQQACPVQ